MADLRNAFLEALAVGESGGDYRILYGGSHFSSYDSFPQWEGVEGPAGISHAAGKYQFEPATWRECAARLRLKDFSPASQDAAAWDLACRVYWHVRGANLEKALELYTDPALQAIATALHSTWTSLSPKTFPGRFRAALGKQDAPAAQAALPETDVPESGGIFGWVRKLFG